jgi:crotonobetainyl-CoA:carnitine CoA-transferase CaiB-like acyl-CoA transferase
VVLDLSRANIGGLVCSSILSEFGAEVIRVEPPEGDPARHFTPFGAHLNGVGLGYLVEARNKHHITLQLESPEGQGLARFLDFNLTWYHAAARIRERIGSLDATVFPYTFVRCRDGYAFLAAFGDASFARLARIMNRLELATDPRFDTLAKRTSLDTAAALVDELEAWSSQFTAQEILAKEQADPHGAPVVTGRVNTPLETFHEENWWARGALQRLSDPLYGEVVVQAPPWKMSETPPRLKWLCRPIGHDNERIYLRYLGLGRSKLRELQARGVI